MSKLGTIFTVMIAGVFAPAFYASSLQDWEFNINGTDYYPGGGATLASIPGLTQSGFNSTTGIGTYQITYTAAASGSFYIGAFFYVPAGIPFYNEYGATSGIASAGETWQVDVPEYDVSSANHGAGTIIDNLAGKSLDDRNSWPNGPTTGNYLNNCGANGGGSASSACNDFVSEALGFSFSLAKGQSETVEFAIETAPGTLSGIQLGDIHPIDGSNAAALAVYLDGSATPGKLPPPPPPPSGVPEPASAGLAVAAAGVLAFAKMRFSRRDDSK
jgi:hypothetical protein